MYGGPRTFAPHNSCVAHVSTHVALSICCVWAQLAFANHCFAINGCQAWHFQFGIDIPGLYASAPLNRVGICTEFVGAREPTIVGMRGLLRCLTEIQHWYSASSASGKLNSN